MQHLPNIVYHAYYIMLTILLQRHTNIVDYDNMTSSHFILWCHTYIIVDVNLASQIIPFMTLLIHYRRNAQAITPIVTSYIHYRWRQYDILIPPIMTSYIHYRWVGPCPRHWVPVRPSVGRWRLSGRRSTACRRRRNLCELGGENDGIWRK